MAGQRIKGDALADESMDVIAPYQSGAADSPVLFFDCTTTSQADVLPDSWAGHFVKITNEGTDLANYLVTRGPTAVGEVDATIAASDDGGAAATLGDSILGETTDQFRLPEINTALSEHLYFVRESGATTSLRLTLRSGRIW